MLAAYQASFATRTLLMHRAVVPFEVVQTIGSVAAGLGGAAFVAARTPGDIGSAIAFGAAATVLGLAAYGVAFAFRGRREQDRANFPFYAAVALLLVASGTTILLDGPRLGLTWSVLAVVAAVLAGPLGRRTLAAHAAGYAVGAAVTTGLLPVASDAILGLGGADLDGAGGRRRRRPAGRRRPAPGSARAGPPRPGPRWRPACRSSRWCWWRRSAPPGC